jgi:DNA-binding response OmpR family regulator
MPLICVRGFEIDPARRCVRGDGRTIEPTDQEFRLLYFLAKSTDVVFSREVLFGSSVPSVSRHGVGRGLQVRRRLGAECV